MGKEIKDMDTRFTVTLKDSMTKIESLKCPHCNKHVEVELRSGQVDINLRKEKDSILPPDLLEERKMMRILKKHGVLDKMQLIRTSITKLGTDYDKIKEFAEDNEVKEADLKLMIKIWQRIGDVFEEKKGFYKGI